MRDIISNVKNKFFKLLFLICLSLSSGCFLRQSRDETALITAYEGYYQAIESNSRYIRESKYYSLSGELTSLPDGTYRYYIFVDDPKIAMYDIVMMAVENELTYEEAVNMMPSFGIFDNDNVNLIPFQSNPNAGYAKGIVISGISQESSIDLQLLVEWKDKNKENSVREFFFVTIDSNGLTIPDDIVTRNGDNE